MLNHYLTVTIPQILSGLSLASLLGIYLAGVLTSISPCMLAMMPVMIGFIGGYGQSSRRKGFLLGVFFVFGLACTFALLGILAVTLGGVFGQVGIWWYYGVALISIVMGLNLLEMLPLRFPALAIVPPRLGGYFGAFVLGLIFGVVASPCTTPVLVAILAMVSTSGKIVDGAVLLFVYGLGHGLPLLLVGTFTVAAKGLTRLRAWTRGINYFSGALLILVGCYFIFLARS